MAKAEQRAGSRDENKSELGRHDGIEAFASFFEFGAVGLQVAQEVEPELVQRKIGERDGIVEVFKIENLVLESLELAVTEEQVFLDQVFELAGIEKVVGLRGGKVDECHAGLDAQLDAEVVVEIGDRPEIDQLHGFIARADAVDTPEPLDDAHRIPVDVVVDQQVAVLKVLAFADAIRGDQQVDFLALVRKAGRLIGAAFGHRREVRQDVVVIRAARARPHCPRRHRPEPV